MFDDLDERAKDEMRIEQIVQDAVNKADSVILSEGVSADDMLQLTYLVGMKMLEKVGFQLTVEKERKRIQKELDAALKEKR